MGYSRLDGPVQFLKGVGPKRADLLKKLSIGTARDLLYHIPRRYDNISTITPISSLEVGMEASVRGEVVSKGVLPTRKGLKIFQAVLRDDSGMITVSWPGRPWLDRKIREGDRILAQGSVKFYHGRQFHPREFTIVSRASHDAEADDPNTVFVSYPSTDAIPQWVLRGMFEKNLDFLLEQIDDDEYLPEGIRKALGLPTLSEAFRTLHRPTHPEEAEEGRRRLAFDEFFFLQLVQALARHRDQEAEPGIEFLRTNEHIRPLHESLPFELTGAQARVLREIFADMASPRRMNRFLQGDVGAGKTLVALFAILLAVESDRQAALMAPTELLAEQHALKLRAMLEPLELPVALLTGSVPTRARSEILESLREGRLPIVVGTHALIQDDVRFARLGLVVVDEQHRFGVRQRMALGEGEDDAPGAGGSPTSESRERPDVLVMSATPIPRSLALTLYGELDLSILDELPPGRTPVRTLLRRPSARDEVYSGIERAIEEGGQAYIVYPLVEESEELDLPAATAEYERLSGEVFPGRTVGLLHGRLPADEKERIMAAFRDGEIDILVSTTVIEVGIDVPNASIMVIEHAERFGLSQLHQLRGRVGRGSRESYCVLISPSGKESWERLEIFASTTDGFEIARADLRLRGQGDLFGAQQHGRDPLLRFADLTRDEALLLRARELARRIIDADPELADPEHAAVKARLEGEHAERLRMWKVG